MSETVKQRQEMDPQYQWNLGSLFENDEAWEKAFSGFDKLTESLKVFQGTLHTAEAIRDYLDVSADAERKLDNLFAYAMLRKSEDSTEEKAQQMYARVYAKYAELMVETAFADPEILSLSDEELQKIAKDERLEPYAFVMEKFILRKPHTLSQAEEALLARFAEVINAPGEISEYLMDADLKFADAEDKEGQKHEVSGSSYIALQSSEDRVLREHAFRSLYKTYKEHINTFAAAYAANVKAATAEAGARHYNSSRNMVMSGSHIPEEVYDNLIETVHKFLPEMYRYVRLRKRLLKLEDLHYYDVYAPLAKGVEEHYTYEQAQEMVLSAVKPLGEEYGKTVRQAFAERWIDVYPNVGKRGGAFSSGTYDSTPFILTNFGGLLDHVSTIAHEMGHSMHTWLANHAQPPQYANYTLFVAEVASTVNENLLIEQLLEKENDPMKRLSYLNQYLEGFKGTVYRQTMFAEFERNAHAMAERGEALTASSLSQIYEDLVKLYFGEELVMDEEVRYEWARIPHFYRPFYVYVYATGYCSAAAISEAILKEGEPAVKKYLEFLAMGGSAYPLDELAHAGVDLRTTAPLEASLRKFASVLDEAEKAADELSM